MFQSTHPRRVRPFRLRRDHRLLGFQSTHPRRVRPNTEIKFATDKSCFNPRTREGCDIPLTRHVPQLTSFNPRTREGCDGSMFALAGEWLVSIHAPAKGATQFNLPTEAPENVSIHAPAKGATSPTDTLSCPSSSFNPRTREGCDWGRSYLLAKSRVSIHAPAKGATYI